MRQIGIVLLAAALLLAGCSGTANSRDPSWEGDWTAMGDHLAIETPEGFVLNESNDVLSLSGLYYATWTCGEGRAYVNSDGKDATVYDGQIYVLLKECADDSAAAQEIQDWMEREKQSYEAGDLEVWKVGGQEFQILPLTNGKASNPYPTGIAAFAVREENGESKPISEDEYIELLKERGKENIVQPLTASESQIAVQSTQFRYNTDYFVGDYMTVEHQRFGLIQPKMQLIGMIESFDQNGRSLTPTFKKG